MPHKFGINSPPSVKHISRKAFFKHALENLILSSLKHKEKGYIDARVWTPQVFLRSLSDLAAFKML